MHVRVLEVAQCPQTVLSYRFLKKSSQSMQIVCKVKGKVIHMVTFCYSSGCLDIPILTRLHEVSYPTLTSL